MRLPEQHLGADEIKLLSGEGDVSDESQSGLKEAREHLQVCDNCRHALSVYRDMASRMEILRNPGGARRQANCPPLEIWVRIASRSLTTKENEGYMQHAANCDHCGHLLKEIWKDFESPTNDDEQFELDYLAKIVMEPHSKILDRKISAVERSRTKNQTIFIWCCSATAIVVFGVLSIVIYRRYEVESVRSLLARSYTEHRNLELRIPGAAFSEWQGRRGKENEAEKPPELDDANSIIKKAIKQHPEDSTWLQLKGRAALLVWDYDEASKAFSDALSLKPNDPSLFIDQAAALFERAELRGDMGKVDLGEAADDLERALKINTSDPVALFNLAIIYDKLDMPHEAIDRWNKYLAIDPTSTWAAEASARLRKLQEHTLEHDRKSMEPLFTPETFVKFVVKDPFWIEERIEDYQDLAIKEWLPTIFSAKTTSQNRLVLRRALTLLGKLLIANHGDYWISDAVKNMNSSSPQGFNALSRSLYFTEIFDPSAAHYAAKNAMSYFMVANNRPGYLRAHLEVVHALQRAEAGRECLKEASVLKQYLKFLNYPWMIAQAEIDEAACWFKVGSFDKAQDRVAAAVAEARAAGYKILLLRAYGMQASLVTAGGDINGGWAIDSEGLRRFWNGKCSSSMRAHQFYDDMTYSAEGLKEWSLARALAQEDVLAISQTRDRAGEALARQHLGLLNLADGDLQQADAELSKSKRLLATLKGSGSAGPLAESEIALAETDLKSGNFVGAEARLQSLKPQLASISNITFPLKFYEVYGDLYVQQKRFREARTSYESGILLGDQKLIQIKRPVQRFTWSQEAAPLYRKIVEVELMNDRPLRALALWEWYRSADLRRESDQFEKYNPFTSSSLLTQAIAGIKDRTFLSYALLPHGLAVWIFDDRGIHGQILSEDPVQLMALSSYFYDICSTPDSDGPRLKAKGRDLYQKLIAPIAHWITRERILVIEADDWMNDLPFAALVDPQGRYLIEENTLSFSSGLLQEQRLRPAQPITKSANAVIIGSTLAPSSLGLLPIPNIGSEARTVAGKFIHPTLLLGSQASFSAVESTAPAAEVFHYVGHAISNLKEEGLVLAGKRPDEGTESIWGAGRWSYGLFKRAQLIVLAACSTGRMSRGRVETHGDLVRALLRAGVPRIVASRWNISSNETSDFISKFYDELLQGKSVPKALQSSSLNVMRDKPAPYYWAGLVEIGK